jgi:isocitrate lyase
MVFNRFVDMWQAEANVKTYGEAVADVMRFRASEGVQFPMTEEQWLTYASTASFYAAKEKARNMGISVIWDCEHAKTPDGYYQVRGGIEYAIAKSPRGGALRGHLVDGDEDGRPPRGQDLRRRHPREVPRQDARLQPVAPFNWDTTGMTRRRDAPLPGRARQARLRLQLHHLRRAPDRRPRGRRVRDRRSSRTACSPSRACSGSSACIESPYRTPQTLVGGPRLDAGLMSISGRTSTTKAMGKGSTQFQHLVQTEVPPKVLEDWLELWRKHHDIGAKLKVVLRPHSAGSELLELSLCSATRRPRTSSSTTIQDRRGRNIISIRDQNTFDLGLRKKRLMTLAQLFLIHRYKGDSCTTSPPPTTTRRRQPA